ncbi:hypothetical protein AQUCO_06900016v1 [Aquilegia coerulea]|uniref:CCHC-type domain-containing protein n=1 Tax=Aquilegia coerulea TaxID=218851 RepID=A0A2G5CB15_AQUCA|nr:hypothetical protein AQUCO_06900016v1 [Aquilegia coerulea]
MLLSSGRMSSSSSSIDTVMNSSRIEPKPPDPHQNPLVQPKSYKAVVHDSNADSQWDTVFTLDKDERETFDKAVTTSGIKGKDNFPKLKLDDNLRQTTEAPWKDAIIAKVIGCQVSLLRFKDHIQRIWRPAGTLSVIDLGNSSFIIKFTDVYDYKKSLLEGPWTIFNHYISLQRWRPRFRSNHTIHLITSVWIQIHNLLIEWFNREILFFIAQALGHPIKLDPPTNDISRGRFARICVEINLNEPLVPHIEVDDLLLPIMYEKINQICFSCGRYGHKDISCPHKIDIQQPNHVLPKLSLESTNKLNTHKDVALNEGNFGLWMIARGKKLKEFKIKLTERTMR